MSLAFFPELLNHLWQSTLCGGLAALLTLAFRNHGAAVRYRIWFAASAKFLLPFSLIAGLGASLDWREPPRPSPMTPISAAGAGAALDVRQPTLVERMAEPLSAAAPVASPVPALTGAAWGSYLARIVLAAWLCGALLSALLWVRQWLRVRASLRSATPMEIDVPARIPAMSSPASIEPSVFGIVRPVLLMPENITRDLTSEQIEAILLHESAHVRRRDNLGAALHMVVEAVFWFNPMVWWIGKGLMEERERACDEQVLRIVAEPETYAEAILKVCKLHTKSPLTCMAGVASSDLRERIERIMNPRKSRDLGFARKALLFAIVAAAVCGPLFVGAVSARQFRAASAAESAFTFASIDAPGAVSTVARGVDSTGRIVGSFVDRAGTHGFLYGGGMFSTLDMPGSSWTIATGINSVGQVVGGYGTGRETGNHGFLFSGGAFSSFDVPGSLDTIAYGINNKGQIVGTFLGADGFRHGFRLSGGTYATVGPPDSRTSSAQGINDAGHIVGLSGDGASSTGFFFDGSSYAKVQAAAVFAEVKGLNNLGDIVGQEGGPQPPFSGFLRSAGRSVGLDLPDAPVSWNAHAINDLGQVVGEFADRDGAAHGYLATPTAFRPQPIAPGSPPPIVVTSLADPSAVPAGAGSDRPTAASGSGESAPAVSPRPATPAAAPGARGRGNPPTSAPAFAALRSAFQRTINQLRRADPGNAFARRAVASITGAIEDAAAAEEFLKKHPEAASVPPDPPKIVPRFEPPESERGRFPGREIPLNILRNDFEMLNAIPGGDLGGYRAKIHAAIASAASETIADIIHEHQVRDLNALRGALQRAGGNFQRTEDSAHVQRGQAALQAAIAGVDEIVRYVDEHPSTSIPPAAPVMRPDFEIPEANRGRYPARDNVLSSLAGAFDLLSGVPGADFGGLRFRLQNDIVTAANEMLASINESAVRDREREREREEREASPRPGGLRGQNP